MIGGLKFIEKLKTFQCVNIRRLKVCSLNKVQSGGSIVELNTGLGNPSSIIDGTVFNVN
jgi:hypothetical protein